MHHRVTVLKNKFHYFSADISRTYENDGLEQAVRLYNDFTRRFPREEGFSVLVFQVVEQVLTVNPVSRVVGEVARA